MGRRHWRCPRRDFSLARRRWALTIGARLQERRPSYFLDRRRTGIVDLSPRPGSASDHPARYQHRQPPDLENVGFFRLHGRLLDHRVCNHAFGQLLFLQLSPAAFAALPSPRTQVEALLLRYLMKLRVPADKTTSRLVPAKPLRPVRAPG